MGGFRHAMSFRDILFTLLTVRRITRLALILLAYSFFDRSFIVIAKGQSPAGNAGAGPRAPQWQQVTSWTADQARSVVVIEDGRSYTEDETGSCKPSDPNEPNTKICLRVKAACQLVTPSDVEGLLAAGATPEGCDERCEPLDCIGRGEQGSPDRPCCEATNEIWAWSDSTRKLCPASSGERCVPQFTSIRKFTELLGDTDPACCGYLIRQGDFCIQPNSGASVVGGSTSGMGGSGGGRGSGSGSGTGTGGSTAGGSSGGSSTGNSSAGTAGGGSSGGTTGDPPTRAPASPSAHAAGA